MASKGIRAKVAAGIKKSFGKHEAVYNLVKKIVYGCLSVFKFLGILSPVDLAYRFFPPEAPLDSGYVTKVDKLGISGLAFRSESEIPAVVELLVEGKVINRTSATQKVPFPTFYAGSSIGFYFPMKHVWPCILSSQSIEVRAAGKSLQYGAGWGRGVHLPNKGVHQIVGKGIIELIGEGRVITKFGRLQSPRQESRAWAEKAFGNYGILNDTFQKATGKSLFAFYGVMLGYAREGGVLAHDMDLDLAYFSEMDTADKVRMEFREITEQLIAAGVTVVAHSYKLAFGGLSLSLTPCWIANGCFSTTFGFVGDGFTVTREDIFPLSVVEHDGFELLLPHDPKAVSAYIYGHGWKYPDPGWKWLPEYKNRPEILAARLSQSDLAYLRGLSAGSTKADGVRQ